MRRSKLTAAEAAAFAAATAEELKRTSEESGSMAGSMALSPRTGVMVTRDPLMSLVAQLRPLIRLLVFPLADEFALGRLNGSEAHAPVVRVLLNATATGARRAAVSRMVPSCSRKCGRQRPGHQPCTS